MTCRNQLSEWITIEQCKPYGIENKTPADWADEVEQLYLKTQHIDQHFNTFNEAQQMINSAFKIVKCEECRKYVEEYYSKSYLTPQNIFKLACEQCHKEKKLNLPPCTYCRH